MVNYVTKKLQDVEFDLSKPVMFDTETCGFYGRIRLAQFYQEGWGAVVLVDWPDPLMLAMKLDEAHIVMHDAHYDITTIQTQTTSRFEPKSYSCTLLLSRLTLYKQDKFSLDAVMKHVLGEDPYVKAGLTKTIMQKANWDVPVLTETQKLYAAIDVYYLVDVYNAVKESTDTTSYQLDMLTLHYCLDFQNNGFPVLDEELHAQYQKNLDEIALENVPINVNSWKQVRPYINSNESDALALAKLTLSGNKQAEQVNKVRKLIKQNSFLAKFDTAVKRVFGKFRPSARSGRLTSKDQNLQQLPRLLKKIFGYTTDDGRVLIYADYAQLEMRSICVIVGELILAKLLRAGGDVHNYVAEMLFGSGFSKIQRQIAKTCNFNLLYGGGPAMLVSILIKDAMILITEVAAGSYKRKWLKLYPAIAAWQERGISAWRKGIPWATPFGRRYLGKMMTDQLNVQNQGFGAEIAKLALHYMMPKLKEYESRGVILINFIHDSYIIECPNDPELYEPVAAIVAEAMQRAWFEALRTGKDLKIRDLPMPVDVFVGYNWGRIEEDYLYNYQLTGDENYEAV